MKERTFYIRKLTDAALPVPIAGAVERQRLRSLFHTDDSQDCSRSFFGSLRGLFAMRRSGSLATGIRSGDDLQTWQRPFGAPPLFSLHSAALCTDVERKWSLDLMDYMVHAMKGRPWKTWLSGSERSSR